MSETMQTNIVRKRRPIGVARVSLLIVSMGFSMLACANRAQASDASNQVLGACQADGATITTAMSAFVAQNPTIRVTAADLVSRAHGGPYLEDWPNNLEFYRYSIVLGVLSVRAGRLGASWVRYLGPTSCIKAGVGKVSNWILIDMNRALEACQADGATVSTAIAAFEAQNPGLKPTARELTSTGYGGPYIESWPHAPSLYVYSIAHGYLFITGANKGSPLIRFSGPSSCRVVGV